MVPSPQLDDGAQELRRHPYKNKYKQKDKSKRFVHLCPVFFRIYLYHLRHDTQCGRPNE